MKRKGCTLTPEEFHEKVNIVFHDKESLIYDEIHSDLKNSLQEQVNLLISDLFNYGYSISEKINMLDIGCGTGLSTEYILNSDLKPFIENITMLDSSEKMLDKAKARAKNWNTSTKFQKGYITEVNEKFDLVIICSVLHHIPDLKDFLDQLDQLINPNGILIHLQDPNADYLDDEIYRQRLAVIEKMHISRNRKKKHIKDFIPKSIRNSLSRLRGRKNYIDLINDQLLKEKIITKRMSADEIWSVTDIHVRTKENPFTNGISLNFLKHQLKNFKLVKQRSYGFYGSLKSDLDDDLKKEEEKLIESNEFNGRNLSCIWMKKM
ncbi:class I SAM-dependent methyltransferase [Christiangramia sp. SM2212]|uniref:Class I SAM-dependent methyltransferase n=1 Tax=Christiangramia sediminicola TaxID=3073267 RepID=A0ABU1EMR9_9FLAO|nr:class I SAM-dependent methyltransferase [Christiangramia sp. SM2212]MDR5589687.1 class I SAM-dependent methyltransferase [Christiangramia sp. SM2212]